MKRVHVFFLLLLTGLLFNGCYMVKKSDTYYGIDTKSYNRVVFILDISGSMEGRAETDLQGNVLSEATQKVGDRVAGEVGGIAGDIIRNQTQEQVTKLGKARKEMIPAIRGLGEDSYFTIIIFENDIKLWRKSLVQATTANKNLAINHLKGLEASGGTNVYEALEQAFELAGEGLTDAAKPLGVETIFLLTDGKPSAGKITKADKIVEQTTGWNSQKRVVVHTIGLGEDCDADFLKALASRNGGKYIDR